MIHYQNMRNSNRDAVSLETIMKFEGFEGMRVKKVMRVLKGSEGF